MDKPLAVVTGGARGIGAAIAEKISANWRVIIADRDLESARKQAHTIGADSIALDISVEDEVNSAIGEVENRFGPIKGLVNCAGPLQNSDRPEDLPMRIWDRMTNVHLRGTWLVTRNIGVRMAARRQGSIVTIASIVGMQAGPLHGYGPAKAALINMMQGLAAEWGADDVRVNCVSPGYVRTPGTERGFAEGVIDAELLAQHTALNRLIEPMEIAAAAAFLLSRDASAITGINLPVDAGFLAAAHWGAFGARPHTNTEPS